MEHMLHLLLAFVVVYVGMALFAFIVVLVSATVVFVRVRRGFKKTKLLMVLPVLVLLGAASLQAATEISNRQYVKEVSGIIKADKYDIGMYQHNPPAGTDSVSAALYVTLVEADLDLLEHGLTKFKHHKTTRADVDKLLAQLSRDLEDVPLPEETPTVQVNEKEETT